MESWLYFLPFLSACTYVYFSEHLLCRCHTTENPLRSPEDPPILYALIPGGSSGDPQRILSCVTPALAQASLRSWPATPQGGGMRCECEWVGGRRRSGTTMRSMREVTPQKRRRFSDWAVSSLSDSDTATLRIFYSSTQRYNKKYILHRVLNTFWLGKVKYKCLFLIHKLNGFVTCICYTTTTT